jgi:hypothetical protein
MIRYRACIRTPWSPARAFEYLEDLEHFADWDPSVTRARPVPDEERGSRPSYDITVSTFGREHTLRYEIVDATPPERLEIRAETSTLQSVDVIVVAPGPRGGAVVTYDAVLELRGLLRLARPLLAVAFRRNGDRAAAGLTDALGKVHS